MKRCYSCILSFLFIVFVTICDSGRLSKFIGLYDDGEDNIRVLDNDNFTSLAVDKPLILQYYLSSCGHCIAYAPLFKNFSITTKRYNFAILPAVINCYVQSNRNSCAPAFSFPTIACWKRGAIKPTIFYDSEPRTLTAYRDTVVSCLSAVGEFSFNSHPEAEFNVITQSNKSAILVHLDHHDQLLSRINVQIDTNLKPGEIIVQKDNIEKLRTSSYDEVNKYLLAFENPENVQTVTTGPKYDKSFKPTLGVYLDDIIAALREALVVDVPLKQNIEGVSRDALNEFLRVLLDLFPFSKEYREAILTLSKFVKKSPNFTGSEFATAVEATVIYQNKVEWVACNGSLPNLRRYPCGLWTLFHTLTVLEYSLMGDSLTMRVPIMMNHFIKHFFSCTSCAVHFATITSRLVDLSKEAIYAPHMSTELISREITPAEANSIPLGPTSVRSEVIWLNLVHNKVNIRTKNTASEDPMVKKIIFPSPSQCPACYSPAATAESLLRPMSTLPDVDQAIFEFLNVYYGRDNLKVQSSLISIGPLPTEFNEFSDNFRTYELTLGLSVFIFSFLCIILLLFYIRTRRHKRFSHTSFMGV